MVLLDNDAFLTEVTKLFAKHKEKGSVFITVKRYQENPTDSESKCLIRATDGKDTKISTLVSSKDVVRFQLSYANILKSQMDNLKRKEKKKKKSKKV